MNIKEKKKQSNTQSLMAASFLESPTLEMPIYNNKNIRDILNDF